MKGALLTWSLMSVVWFAGCGAEPSGGPTPPPKPEPSDDGDAGDRGGMWMPEQMPLHAETLKKLGLALDPAALSDPMAAPLGAVVYLGGCSASFVSPDGLIVTNHHCATGALQFNSPKDGPNLLELGYLAKTRAEEKSNGPSDRVFVTQAFRDVTATVRADLDKERDDKKRYDLVEKRQKELVAECEKDRPEIRCSLVSFFGGEKYMLVEQLEIRDVRLVYAPAEGIGNFGGEIDNWRWPRQAGDYAFYRAYVGPDGKPADYDEKKNVPYKPKHYLRVSTAGLQPGDMVMVAGYPARTSRIRTASEVAEAVDWYYPRRLKLCNDYIALLEKLAKESPELDIKGRHLLRGLSNILTNTKGLLDGLVKGGLKDEKIRLEAQLKKWIAAHPEHASAAVAIENLQKHYDKYRGRRDEDAATQELLFFSALLEDADTIVRMAEERPKPDPERHPDFQQRNHKRIEQAMERGQQNYARRLDMETLKLALLRAQSLPQDKRPEALRIVLAGAEPTDQGIQARLESLYGATKLEKLDARLRLFRTATLETLRASTDPFIKVALELRPLLQAIEDRSDAYEGATMMDRPKFAAALRAKQGGVLAPDANSTLRVTFGTVRGYKPKVGAAEYYPFTKLSELVAKNTGKEPFNAPENLIEAAKQGPFAPYVDKKLGEVPVNFLADLDITMGNSGSPTLNGKGELVGLAFDGNYEAMASDWVFIPSITRSIHVDIRYTLWIMDRVDKADHLLKEMGIEPAIP
jgi:hypothetical protein